MQSLDAIAYGGKEIAFYVQISDRKTMEIAVHPDSRVIVKAPKGISDDEIRGRVYRRARWITRQINYFQQFCPRTPGRQYVSGETHLYLGRQYRLKVSAADDAGIKLARGFIYINYFGKPSLKKVQLLLDGWYLERARIKYTESVDRCYPGFQRMGYAQPIIHIRRMKTRWGSLSSMGALTLNRDLIRAPRDCIDYVVTHELCHLKYKDHSRAFYKLLEQVMPDWERRKHRLELALV
jgi:hypothetical protein